MRHIYEITEIDTKIKYTNYVINDDGTKSIGTEQIVLLPKLWTLDQIKENAVTKIAPGETIEIIVADNLTN